MSATLTSQLFHLSTNLVLYYLTPIYIIGVLGNVFNIIIFSRRNLRANTCSQYFICMSIAQIIMLNSLAITRIITYSTGYDPGQISAAYCKIRSYLYVLGIGLMRQFLCSISIDRWIVSTRNARIRRLSSPRVVRWIIFGNTLFWISYSIHALIGYQSSPTRGCISTSNSDYGLFYGIQSIVWAIMPFIIMVVFSVLTLRNVRSRRLVQMPLQNDVASTTVASISPQSTHHHRREMQLIKLSILQVIFYVFLCMIVTYYPLYSVLTSSQTKTSDQTAIDAFLSNTSLLLIYTYNAITFFIYTIASKTFRKEFRLTCSQIFQSVQHFFNNCLN